MSSAEFFECYHCRAMFRKKKDLQRHLEDSPRCNKSSKSRSKSGSSSGSSSGSVKSAGKAHDPHAFTAEAEETVISTIVRSGTVPDTATSLRGSKSSAKKEETCSTSSTESSLLGAMMGAMKKPVKRSTKTGLEMSVLSAIAEGDDDLATAYSKLSIDPETGAPRLTKDIVGEVSYKAKISVVRAALLISRAQLVSLCFVLDTTGSMVMHINGVKEQILEIVGRVEESGCKFAGLAFVGYKDWCDGPNHFEVLPFTKDLAAFRSFVGAITATGGGDTPEDVVGGIDKAVMLDWPEKSGTRVLFHLGDAPPHGKGKYHDDLDDSLPTGHEADRPLDDLFLEIRKKKIMYYFGRINNLCDTMIRLFEHHYNQKIDRFDTLRASTITAAVTGSVMRSVSLTSSATTSATRTDHLEERDFILVESEPDWSKLPIMQGTILTFDLPESITAITKFAKLEDKVFKCRMQIAANPFAKGSIRLVYYGKLLGKSSDEVVFKEMISLPKVPELDRQRYMTDLEVQTIAAKLAFEFNGQLSKTPCNPKIRVKFLMAKVVRTFKEDGVTPRFLAYEKRFRGKTPEMVKYTNNMSFVRDPETLDDEGRKLLLLAVAFSHFSHDVTGGYLLVCDLQGISTVDGKGQKTLLLTDPAIHCATHCRFGKTNLQAAGISKFFEKHACNEYCAALKLAKPGSVVKA